MNSFQFSESPNRLSYWNLNDFGTGGTLTRIPLNCNYPCGDLAVPSNCPNPLPDPSGSDPGRASGGCAVRGVAGVGSVLPEGGGYVRERAAPAEKLRPGGEARRLCGEGRGLGIGSPGPLTHYRFPELQETPAQGSRNHLFHAATSQTRRLSMIRLTSGNQTARTGFFIECFVDFYRLLET